MKTIICGSQPAKYMDVLSAINSSGFSEEITHVISGGDPEVDCHVEEWANSIRLPFEVMEKGWSFHLKANGPIRNSQSISIADAVIAVWDGRSPVVFDIIKRSLEMGIKLYIHKTGISYYYFDKNNTYCLNCGRQFRTPLNEHARNFCSVGCQYAE